MRDSSRGASREGAAAEGGHRGGRARGPTHPTWCAQYKFDYVFGFLSLFGSQMLVTFDIYLSLCFMLFFHVLTIKIVNTLVWRYVEFVFHVLMCFIIFFIL